MLHRSPVAPDRWSGDARCGRHATSCLPRSGERADVQQDAPRCDVERSCLLSTSAPIWATATSSGHVSRGGQNPIVPTSGLPVPTTAIGTARSCRMDMACFASPKCSLPSLESPGPERKKRPISGALSDFVLGACESRRLAPIPPKAEESPGHAGLRSTTFLFPGPDQQHLKGIMPCGRWRVKPPERLG